MRSLFPHAVAIVTALTVTGSSLTATAPPAAAAPTPVITTVASGLTIPWDVTWVGSTMLFDERPGRLWSLQPGGTPQRVSLDLPPIFTNSESGMLGMVADPNAASNGLFYTCLSVAKDDGTAKDVEVWKWQLTDATTAVKVKTLITGIPVNKGRHNGCRLRFRSSDRLYIGTGDAAQGTNPQNLKSLGGKVLRVTADGTPRRRTRSTPKGVTRGTCGPMGIATCKASPTAPTASTRCGRSNTAPVATTRSIASSAGRTTGGRRRLVTTSPVR